MQDDETHILYNADCPICRVEIDSYRRRALKDGLPLRFDTLDEAERWGIPRDQAARRLHIRKGGQMLSGLPAFRALWAEMPGFRWLAWVTGLWGVRQVAGAVYDHLLAPGLYAMHRRRERRKALR